MTISRRSFLGTLSSFAAIVPFARNLQAQSRFGIGSGKAGNDALARLGWNSFGKYRDTDFTFSDVGSRLLAKNSVTHRLSAMVEAPPYRGAKSGDEPKCFVLTFTSPVDLDQRKLKQDTYAVDHAALGHFELFISEASIIDGEIVHTAVVNRAAE